MDQYPPKFDSSIFNNQAFSTGDYLTEYEADRRYLSINYAPYMDLLMGITDGVASANKALVFDSGRNCNNIGTLTMNGSDIDNLLRVGDIENTGSGVFRILTSGGTCYLQTGTNTTFDSSADLFFGNYERSTSTSSRKVMLKADGKLGVGTTVPTKELTINNSTGQCLRLVYNNNNGTETGSYTDFIQSGQDLVITGSNADQIGSSLQLKRRLIVDSALGAMYMIMRTDDVAGITHQMSFFNNYSSIGYPEVAAICVEKGTDNNKGNLLFKTQHTNSGGSFRTQMKIGSNGHVLLTDSANYLRIGSTTDPVYPLDISSSTNFTIPGVNYGYYLSTLFGVSSGSPTFATSIRSAGSMIVSSGGYYTVSDRRVKENVKRIKTKEAIDFVKNVDMISFNEIGSDRSQIGCIAQDVAKYDPRLINLLPNDTMKSNSNDEPEGVQMCVDYARIAVLQGVVIRDLLERVEKLEKAKHSAN